MGDEKADKKAASILAKIAKMPAPYGSMGARLHGIIMANAPTLEPTWRWGLPFYRQDGKDICYFKKEDRCMTFGFGEDAVLAPDEKTPQLKPCAWNFTQLDAAAEARIAAMVKQAIG